MISLSRLLCDTVSPEDYLRYREITVTDPRPVVVWNFTKQCNLTCKHCYARADNRKSPGKWTPPPGKHLLTTQYENR